MKVNDPKGLKNSDHGVNMVASKLANQCKPANKKNQVMSVKKAFLAQKDIKINQKLTAIERNFQAPTFIAPRTESDHKISSLREFCSPIAPISDLKHSDDEEMNDSWLNPGSDGKPDSLNLAGCKHVLKSRDVSPISRDRVHKKQHSDSSSTKDHESSTSLREMLMMPKFTLSKLPSSEESTPKGKKAGSRDCKSMNELLGQQAPVCAKKVLQAKKTLLRLAIESSPCLPAA